MSYTKITQADLTGKGVIGLPDTPNLSTTDIQEKFDEIALDVIVPKFNDLSDELDASDIDSAIKSADITDMRLNADMAIEVSDDHGSTWSGTASSGHRIMDGSGTIYTQESKLQFSNNVTIQDDSVNGITKVLIQPGEKGDPGKAATITIGDVTEGVTASVTNVGSQTDAIFDITLPKGDPGDAATIAVGTVTSGATASVINSGTSDAAVFNFVLPKGDQGDPGTGLTLLGTYATLADLQTAHPTGQRGNAYFVGDDTLGYVYLWDPDTSAWVNIGELKGPKGNTGATPSLSIGTVQTGTPSAVTITGTTEYPVLNFTLEQGDKGDTGNAGTIAVGSVTSGQTASVTNVGTSTAAVFDFVLPKGDKGDQGNPTTVNGKSGNNVTLYGTDIDISSVDNTKLGDIKGGAFLDTNIVSATEGDAFVYDGTNAEWVNRPINKVTSLAVDLTGWTSDTTSQSGTTLYKKQVSLNHVYVESPTVDIGASGVLPTVAEQESYNLLQYCTVDDTVPCLYLYAFAIPTTAFYIKVEGVD